MCPAFDNEVRVTAKRGEEDNDAARSEPTNASTVYVPSGLNGKFMTPLSRGSCIDPGLR